MATIKRVGVLVVAIVVLSLFLGGVTYDSYQTATTEAEITDSVEAELDHPRYDGFELIGVDVRTRSEMLLFQQADEVVVTVGVPPGTERPGLALAIQERLDEERGLTVDVQVRYVEIERGA